MRSWSLIDFDEWRGGEKEQTCEGSLSYLSMLSSVCAHAREGERESEGRSGRAASRLLESKKTFYSAKPNLPLHTCAVNGFFFDARR